MPFRNSELTKLLQPSIGGNSLTSIVCTVTPAEAQRRETRFTIDFGMMAKKSKCHGSTPPHTRLCVCVAAHPPYVLLLLQHLSSPPVCYCALPTLLYYTLLHGRRTPPLPARAEHAWGHTTHSTFHSFRWHRWLASLVLYLIYWKPFVSFISSASRSSRAFTGFVCSPPCFSPLLPLLPARTARSHEPALPQRKGGR